ncbi:MAG: AMP-binding protein [Dechloromonas sp.]|nr:AMP-binding protein [Dechloromonas sp.]
MADNNSLAHHLRQAASAHPNSPALISGGTRWSFAELLADTLSLAERLGEPSALLVKTGDSLALARHAYACSLNQQAFWPLEPHQPRPETTSVRSAAALIISTSGSEGQPRPVRLGNGQLNAAAAAANALLGLGPGDLWLNCLPLYHIGGQSILWRCARAAAGVLLHDGFAAAAVADDLAGRPVTHISLVPATLARLLELGTRPPPGLRVALIGGAALALPLYDKARAAGWPLYPSYGMTESAALVAVHRPSDGAWHSGLVGKPLPGHDIRLDRDGRIALRGPQVMLGYLDGSGVDADGWLTTSDLGAIDANGRLTVSGRADDILISGGRNVHPLEIESCLAACPGVRDVAVTGQPDPVWGDLVVALVVGDASADEVLAHARRQLPSAALPRKLVFLERLPRNATGKLERPALRRIAAGGAA